MWVVSGSGHGKESVGSGHGSFSPELLAETVQGPLSMVYGHARGLTCLVFTYAQSSESDCNTLEPDNLVDVHSGGLHHRLGLDACGFIL